MVNAKRGRRTRRHAALASSISDHSNHPVSGANYRAPFNPYPPVEIINADQVQRIHQASLKIIEETGLRVLCDEGRQILDSAGADVDNNTMMVRMDRGLVMESVRNAPAKIEMIHRNPERSNAAGEGRVVFSAVGGAPNVTDLDNGKRPGSLRDFENFLKLSQSYDIVHMVGGAPEPVDIDTSVRHLKVTQAIMTLTDKFPFVYCRGKQAIHDSFEIVRLANGLSREAFNEGVYCNTVVNTNSPLQLDIPMTQGIIEFARAGQLTIITPFTLSGAMAPVTLSGALVLQNLEALFGIALAQIVCPGSPVAYGGFTSNVDMKSGSPAFGTPEYTKAALASGQLARFYNIPWRSSNVNASNAPDAQSAYESQMALWGALMGGANIIKHGAGWLEGGLTASYEKFILDIEMLQMFAEVFHPFPVTDDDMAVETITDVGPGGHFFGTQHTIERYKTAFYQPLVSDWQNFGAWTDAGSKDSASRANEIYKRSLTEYQKPALDRSIEQALQEFVDKRTREGGVQIY